MISEQQKTEWYNLEQLAVLMNVSYATIKRWKASGYLPQPSYIGRCTRWNKQTIDAWINQNEGIKGNKPQSIKAERQGGNE